MLIKMREKSGGLVVKTLLVVLAGSFAVFFGFGDFARLGGGQNAAIAVVGDTEILVTRFEREYRLQLRQITNRLGIDLQEARRLGIGEAVLQQMIGDALFGQAADDKGIAVADSLVRSNIRNSAAYSRNGEFDAVLYQRILANRGISQEYDWAQNRQNIARAFLTDSLVGGAAAPERLAEAVFRHRQERRIAEIVVIASNSVGDVGRPDEPTLGAFHADNPGRFMAPEYRAITFVSMTPETLVAEVVVPENEIEDEYGYRGDQYFTPEQRDIEQLIYADETAALAARQALVEGADIAALAGTSGALNAGDVAMGPTSRADLPEEIADPVFALAEGGVSAPFESPFGWNVLRVTAIMPELQRTLADVRDEIEHDLALQRAATVLIEFGDTLQDELAAGATLAAAAARLDLAVGRVEAVDARGLTPSGVAAAGLPDDREGFLRAAFEAGLEYETPLIDTADGGAFMLLVERATPPELRPLESVREAAIEAWREGERRRAAENLAESLAAKALNGEPLGGLAAARGLSVRTTEALGRGRGGPDISANLIAKLFEAAVGEVVTAPRTADGGHVVARLIEVVPPERHGDDAGYARLKEGLGRGIGQDLMAQYQDYLAADLGVEVNQGRLDALF